jgi:hypothetical protein
MPVLGWLCGVVAFQGCEASSCRHVLQSRVGVQDDRRAVLKVGVPVGFVLRWELAWWLTADRDRIAPGTARRAAQSFARSVRHKMIDAYRRPLRGVTRVEDAGASWYATLSCGHAVFRVKSTGRVTVLSRCRCVECPPRPARVKKNRRRRR